MTTVFGEGFVLNVENVQMSEERRKSAASFCSVSASTASADVQLDADAWDNKTITSGLKDYFRCRACSRSGESLKRQMVTFRPCAQVSG